MKKEKKYFVPNYKNNAMSIAALIGGGALALWSIFIFAWIGLILGAVLFISGAGVAVLQPTHALVSEKGITLYYGFGIFSESAEWENVTAVYEKTYIGKRKKDREKVFSFEGMTSKSYRPFMKGEIEQNKKLRGLIVSFWGEPVSAKKE